MKSRRPWASRLRDEVSLLFRSKDFFGHSSAGPCKEINAPEFLWFDFLGSGRLQVWAGLGKWLETAKFRFEISADSAPRPNHVKFMNQKIG